jgi:hypothetical protein
MQISRCTDRRCDVIYSKLMAGSDGGLTSDLLWTKAKATARWLASPVALSVVSPHAFRRELMMRGTKRATWTWLLGMLLAGGIGFGAGALQREAHAQSVATSTIYVPAGGLVFRAADGTPLARLSRGAHGGSFELFDDRGETRAAPAKDAANAVRALPAVSDTPAKCRLRENYVA